MVADGENTTEIQVHIRVAGEKILGVDNWDSFITRVDRQVADYILLCAEQNTNMPIIRDEEIGESAYVVTIEEMARDAYNRAFNFGVSQDSFYRLAKQVDAARGPLLSRIAELEAKLEAVKADTERLDWLENRLRSCKEVVFKMHKLTGLEDLGPSVFSIRATLDIARGEWQP